MGLFNKSILFQLARFLLKYRLRLNTSFWEAQFYKSFCDPLLLNMALALFNLKERLKWICKEKGREESSMDKH